MSKALIVVDVQNDFIDGSLAVADGEQTAHRIATVLDLDSYDQIVTTQDWHISPGYANKAPASEGIHWSAEPDFVNTWPIHCQAFSHGAELSPRLDPILDRIDARFYKGAFSAAYSGFEGFVEVKVDDKDDDRQCLAAWLREHGVTEVDVVGIATDYCVKATALDAVKEGFATIVLLSYCAAVDASAEGTGAAAIAEMRAAGVRMGELT